jgi:hypothetical protein
MPANAKAGEGGMVVPAEHDLALKHKHDTSQHTHLQWLLAKIGLKVGCQVWIASNDHSKVWMQERLGDLSLSSLPILAESEFQRIIGRIDVLWLQHNQVVAAYEIERTTDITTGVLRLYDLGVLSSQRQVYLCIITPKERIARVQFELSRPTFDGHDLHRHWAIIDEEMLLQHGEHILRWASSPSVIEDLTCYLGSPLKQRA